VEYFGSEMPRILKAYPKESFIFTANFIRTVFPISREALELERETPVKTPDRILQLLREKPTITLAEMATTIGKSLSAVERASAKLVKAGQLKHIGPQKGGYWEVVEDGMNKQTNAM
jgi:ATP-dependent DNA helicase RecG